MKLEISDRFYEPYSFAIDFGHGQKQEIEYVKEFLIKKGLTGTNAQIKDCLDFVKHVSPIIRETCVDEITTINKITKKEKITGGIIPPEILIGYEMYKEIIDLAVYGSTAIGFANKLSRDKIYKCVSKAISKLTQNKKMKKLFNSKVNKLGKQKSKKRNTQRKATSKSRKTKSKRITKKK